MLLRIVSGIKNFFFGGQITVEKQIGSEKLEERPNTVEVEVVAQKPPKMFIIEEVVKSFMKEHFGVLVFENIYFARVGVDDSKILETEDKKVRVEIKINEGFTDVGLVLGFGVACRWMLLEKDGGFLWEKAEYPFCFGEVTIMKKIERILGLKFNKSFVLVGVEKGLQVDKRYQKLKDLLEQKYQINLTNFENNPISQRQLNAVQELLLESENVINNDQEIAEITESLYEVFAEEIIDKEHKQINLIMSKRVLRDRICSY